MTGKRAEPRVAFVSLIDTRPDDARHEALRRQEALGGQRCAPTARSRPATRPVRSTASAPLVQGLDACNGWTFWHYERAGGLTQIDELRRIVRVGMEKAGA